MNRKAKKHSGWVTPKISQKIKHSEMIKDALEPQPFYDDWCDHRDGFRTNFDKTQIRSEQMFHSDKEQLRRENEKLKKQVEVRKAKEWIKKLKQKAYKIFNHR